MQEIWWKICYTLWPPIKVRMCYYWWIVRYGGKKNIPREVIFGAMAKSMERMNNNLRLAVSESPDDLSKEDHMQMLKAIEKAEKMQEDIEISKTRSL